jgi:hypothetical protein
VITVEVLNLENLIPLELVSALSEDMVLEVMRDVVNGARDYWIQLAKKQFHTTKVTYIDAIREVEWRGKDTAVIALVGMVPNILEQGMRSVDMHDTLLGPGVPSVPVGKKGKHPRKDGGYYRAIPFRHYTPGAGSYGAQMGKALEKLMGAAYSKRIGAAVYAAAKKLQPTLSDPYTGKTLWGERLDAPRMAELQRRKNVNIPKIKPYHATDPYSGMVRMAKTYNSTQSSYKTFRTIAVDGAGQPVGSSPWIRPATPGANLAQQVCDYVGTRLAPMTFQAYVNGLR